MNINQEEFIGDILIVDDNVDNIRFLSDFLMQQGYQVRKSINGEVGLMAARTVIPDLILLDINMPGIGGYEVCQKLKEDEKTRSTPIIFLSAGDEVKDKVKAFQVGGIDYITKPFQLEEVLIRIQTQLQLKVLQKKLQNQNEALQQTVTSLQTVTKNLEQSEAELQALFKAMTESILVFDGEGHYLKIATPNTKLLYKPDQERIGKKIHEILPQKQADILLEGIQKAIKTQSQIEVEYRLTLNHKKTDLCANLSPISSTSVLCVIRDISERKRREEALKLIVEGTASKTGHEFFRSCVRGLAEILGVRYTVVTECSTPEKMRVRTLAFWLQNNFIDNIEYDLKGTPCHEVIANKEYSCYSDGIINRFPQDQDLVELKARSYAGIPLIDSTGIVIGHIAVLDTNPMQDDQTRELVLKIFAARAGAELERQITDRALQESQERSERLLLNILPSTIAERLKTDTSAIAEHFDEVTILFADIVGFTPLSIRVKPDELVNILNEIFSAFDELTEKHGLEKIKTIGDAYMAVGGLPLPNTNHAESVAQMALDMQGAIAHFQAKYQEPLQMRIGINTGSVVAGVIGVKKFIYDLWGDAVNVASRMESSGLPGKIQVTENTYERLKHRYNFEKRGQVEVKGKGEMTTYWLIDTYPH
ncbi:adenylate/guanylate cyclase domain-containing protein [Planktothrix sp. FACHB-1365]|uniref:adenylate/guanylate cyclase domain-containing protein n=1 Tax=Planktothrix sp. FACHB-1365 TaxID=2692855 RepID=UPI001681DF86|nr:adenylate/guanylate cyclase domain-containing protein [Planktothrix sp. FACHB-1365]MBD2482317.1 response regulator [Planktothrix sp. FACHB-1365]